MKNTKMTKKALSTAILIAVLSGGVIVPFAEARYISINANTDMMNNTTRTDNTNDDGAKGANSIVIGKGSQTNRQGTLFVGNGIIDEGIGNETDPNRNFWGSFVTVLGNNVNIRQPQPGFPNDPYMGLTAVGSWHNIMGRGAQSYGFMNTVLGPASLGIGNILTVNGTKGENVGIVMTKFNGGPPKAERQQGIYGDGNVGIGSGVLITSKRNQNNTYPVKAVAIGYDTRVYATVGAIAIGDRAYNYTQGGIALGSESHTTKEGTENGEKIYIGYNPSNSSNAPDNPTWRNNRGELSIGKYDSSTGQSSISRRIANVAAGYLDGDAVNVAQLKAVELKVKDDATTPTTAYINLKNDTLNVGGDKNITTVVSTTTTGSGNATTTEKKITVSLKDTLTGITSITNNTTTKTNGSIITFNDDKLEINTKKITGLTDGDVTKTSTDAVTGKQLYTYMSNVTTALGGGAEMVESNGAFTAPQYDLYTKTDGAIGTAVGATQGGQYSNVGAALTALDKGLKKVVDDGLIFSNAQDNITAKLGKKVTIESAGANDADKLITVEVAQDTDSGAKYSLGIDTAKLKTKLATGQIANGNTDLVTGGTVFAALSDKLDITTYTTDMTTRVTTTQLNTALDGKLDATKAVFKLAGDNANNTANINLNVADAPLVQLKGDGEGISVALDGNALKVSANTVKTNADVTNNTNANKLVTASGLTSYAESNYAKLDAANLLDNAGTASTVTEANQKNWGLALSKDANIDTTPANTKGILVTDSQVGQALSNLEIKYKYDNQNANSVKLSDGFTFKVGDGERDDDTKALKKGLAISVEDDGMITFGLDKDTRDKIDSAIASTNEFIVEAGANTNVSKDDKEVGKIKYTVNLNDTLTDVNSITSKANTNLTLTRNAGSSISLTDSSISLTAGTGADAKTLTLGQDGRLSGISDGVQDTDAVNVRQLNAKTATIQNITKNITQVVNNLESNAYAGIAGAVAAANIPQAVNVNQRYVFGIGYGTYHGQNALAMGISGTNKNKDVLWRITSSYDSTDSWSVGAGLGFTFGPKTSSHANVAHDAIKKYEERINSLEKANKDYEDRITALEKIIAELKKN